MFCFCFCSAKYKAHSWKYHSWSIQLEFSKSASMQGNTIPKTVQAHAVNCIFANKLIVWRRKLIEQEVGCYSPAIASKSISNIQSGTHKFRLLKIRLCNRGTFPLARTLGHGAAGETENDLIWGAR